MLSLRAFLTRESLGVTYLCRREAREPLPVEDLVWERGVEVDPMGQVEKGLRGCVFSFRLDPPDLRV